MKKEYRIPLVWQEYGHVYVEAESQEEAIEIALGPDVPLPDGEHVEDSVEVDRELLELEGEDAEVAEVAERHKFKMSLDAEIEWLSTAKTKEDAIVELFEALSYVEKGELVRAEYDYDIEEVDKDA